ncbi:hypothetical protein [Microbacterium sp. MPKO10]|uniref:hypothetical protein n=1 Tax=Microbacterium sp. MPKO10 TaxID=2989818 RepID=UPI002235C798|nr:hypothetical protein [Microbacterium sp. MPKO10]MCW4456908.1 hypothetical protein [Microbacterium sp. MPKO10]
MRSDVTFDPLMREPSVDDIDAFRRHAENGRHGELASAAHSGASSRTIALISAAALCVIAIPVLIIGNWITWILVPIVCVAISSASCSSTARRATPTRLRGPTGNAWRNSPTQTAGA